MAARIDPNCKEPSDTEDHKFYLPSHVPYGSPKRPLKIHQNENSADQQAEIEEHNHTAQDGITLEGLH